MKHRLQPFSRHPGETVAALGEVALLRAMRGWLGQVSPPPPHGMGDDCAVLRFKPGAILAKTDGVVFGRHFDKNAPPRAVGAKLLKRNLSDIAAMGGTPRHALIHLLLARNASTKWLEQFYRGLAQCCKRHDVTLAGGGMAQGPDGVFAADLLLMGEAGAKALTRTGARLGDALYVTGELGGSILGRHLKFTPRLVEGRWLAQQDGVRSMIDVSDGLAKDLPEILPLAADARLDVSALPVAKAARKLSKQDGQSPLEHALIDGEDHELLLAFDVKKNPADFEKHWERKFKTKLTRIGFIAPASEKKHSRQLRDLQGEPLLPRGRHGFEHLR